MYIIWAWMIGDDMDDCIIEQYLLPDENNRNNNTNNDGITSIFLFVYLRLCFVNLFNI